MRRIRIFEEAATEVIEAAVWYEQERPGLGVEFSIAIDAAFDLLMDDVVPLTTMPGRAGARGAKRLVFQTLPL